MHILLVEDEIRVSDFIRRGLAAEGWAVTHANDGETALAIAGDDTFDVIILDLMLPGISGIETCRILRARKNFTPILILSALDSIDERIAGLKTGADDYLAKPFDFDELIARLDALHRRGKYFLAQQSAEVPQDDGVVFDKRSMMVLVDGEPIDLSAKEREILVVLMSGRGRVCTRERILNSVWGSAADPLTNVIDVYIARLRRKLRHHGNRITTLRSVGYRFD